MKKTAFERYAPFIREYIYKKGWNELKTIQVEACEAILDTNKDIIIASGTASGKTEAAFFPILTDLEKNPSDTISVLYIGPLKALINDQFKRLTELLENHDLPIWPWHGDISQTMKNNAKKINKGIIQITPESLESLLINHPDVVEKLFSDLRYIIIDEIHSLMGADRGLQVISLIERIEQRTHKRPRRVGLSATLKDYYDAERFLSSGHPENVISMGLNTAPRSLGLSIESFIIPQDELGSRKEYSKYLNFVYERTRLLKSLIFTNSRSEAETIISGLRLIANSRKEPDIFYVHHGSISAELRREAENALKESTDPVVTAATLTLELGIDIGDLDQTLQIGAPFSCSSFVQRLGRSGRKTGRPLMRFIDLYSEPDELSPDSLPWSLLRSIAIIELYLKEKWVEPYSIKKKPYSLLIHQTLSTLASYGELTPAQLARHVLTLYPFKDRITTEEYKHILRLLIEKDVIQQMEEGTLIIGLQGERYIHHYTFYAVFADNTEVKIIYKGQEIGSITDLPNKGEVISLAGKSWLVTSINFHNRTAHVKPTQETGSSKWFGSLTDIHPKIIEKIRDILIDDTVYPYLQPGARDLLMKARDYAKKSGMLSGMITNEEYKTIYLFPWTGTKEMRTLQRLLLYKFKKDLSISGLENYRYYLEIKTSLSPEIFFNKLKSLNLEMITPDDVLEKYEVPRIDKFDDWVPDRLLRTAYLENKMNVEEVKKVLREL